jgi:hypothetical protein
MDIEPPKTLLKLSDKVQKFKGSGNFSLSLCNQKKPMKFEKNLFLEKFTLLDDCLGEVRISIYNLLLGVLFTCKNLQKQDHW